MQKWIYKWIGVIACGSLLVGMLHFVNPDTETTDFEDDIYIVNVDVNYGQTEGRRILGLVNNLRSGEDAWYWNSDNTTRTVQSDLSSLTYDYELEKIAMQRAAEIAIAFGHGRPSGQSWDTAFTELNYSGDVVGENLAYGQKNYTKAHIAFAEEDQDYSGQGHRRLMLSQRANVMAVGHVYYQGRHFWVEEFGYKAQNNSKATAANDSLTTAAVQVAGQYILATTITVDSSATQTLLCGQTYDLSEGARFGIHISGIDTDGRKFETSEFNDYYAYVNQTITWSMDSNPYVSYSFDMIDALTAGTAYLYGEALDRTNTIEIKVSHNWDSGSITQQPTCTSAGSYYHVLCCANCGKQFLRQRRIVRS